MTTAEEYLEKRWTALILLCVAQFIVVLDASIVNVALPTIGKALNFSEENLPWVVNAYVIAFGGFLLLGGRAADLLGRRRVFMAGLIVVGIASLAAGFAATQGQLIAARAAQGLGAAIVSPSALSIVTSMFGLAVLSTIATTRTENVLATGHSTLPNALTEGFQSAFLGGAMIAALGVVATLVLIRTRDSKAHVAMSHAEAAPVGS